MSEFESITFLPDGSLYDSDVWSTDALLSHCPEGLFSDLSLDSVKLTKVVHSPIGELQFVWAGSPIFGAATILRNDVMINTAVFVSGLDIKEGQELLQFYIESWREQPIVQELVGGNSKTVFSEALNGKHSQFMVSVNWAAIAEAEYNEVAYYDLFIASTYFELAKKYQEK
jgi:hypothetical protein